MKVLLVSHTCQSPTEGQPRAEWLARLGIDITVLVPDRWKHYGAWRPAAVPPGSGARYQVGRVCWPWTGPGQFYLHWYPALPAILKNLRPDIVDLWEEPWGLVSAHTCWLRERLLPDTRIVSETEQNINKDLPFPFEQFRRYVLQRADYTVGRSEEAVRILRHKGYVGPAQVVPNAVDETLFTPMDVAAARDRLQWTGFMVGYVGRWVAEKGLEDALQALLLCPPQVRLAFVGDGPLEMQLRTQATAMGLEERVVFIPGQPPSALPALLNAMDVLILPSRTTARWKEQFGRVIIEAQACGIPVIGSNSGAIPEVVGEAGLVVPERDPAALAEAINRLLQNPELRLQLANRGRPRVLENFTWRRVAERMAAIYEAAMALPR